MEANYKFSLRSPQSVSKTDIQAYFYHSGGRFRHNFRTKIIPSLWNKETQTYKKSIPKYIKEHPHIKTKLEIVSNWIDKLQRLTQEWIAKHELTNDSLHYSKKVLIDFTDIDWINLGVDIGYTQKDLRKEAQEIKERTYVNVEHNYSKLKEMEINGELDI